jgi:hypothetical protein
MKIAGAVGTGIGIGDQPAQAVIEVYIDKLTPEAQAATPAAVDGVPRETNRDWPVRCLLIRTFVRIGDSKLPEPQYDWTEEAVPPGPSGEPQF